MGDKPYKLVIKVDLSCCRCRKAIQDYLCRMQRKVCMQIVSIDYDLKKDVVVVSCPSNPEELKRKLLCKFPKIIKGIEIKQPEVTPPKPDKNKKVFMDKCEEKYKDIRKREKKCKKECERKCMEECKNPFPPNQPPMPQDPWWWERLRRWLENERSEQPKQLQQQPTEPLTLRMHPWPQQVPIACCACPCPCWTAWSNNYRCCSCGVESWPGRSGPDWGSGPSYGGTPQWSNCEPCQPTNIIPESTEQPCSMM